MKTKTIQNNTEQDTELRNIFPMMEQHATNDILKRFRDDCKLLGTEKGIIDFMQYNDLKYQNNHFKKCLKFLTRIKDKKVLAIRTKLNRVSQAQEFTSDLIITLEWHKSFMWGSNPTAYTNYGFKSGSIGGSGYCKTSTATAQALNSDDRILKLLYIAKENALKLPKDRLRIDKCYYDGNKKVDHNEEMRQSDINRAFLGYGSGYDIIPKFEGGVGVDSHIRILKNLGLIMESITNTKSVNVYRIFRVVV
jgi:hypothetical protein